MAYAVHDVWEHERADGWRWQPAGWVADPLERMLLLAIVVLTAYLAWALVAAEQPDELTAGDRCVIAAVDDAQAFAAVLGDRRAVPASFAVEACGAR